MKTIKLHNAAISSLTLTSDASTLANLPQLVLLNRTCGLVVCAA